ncbi:MAG: D-glycero-beta-D-manno-heptose 1-phosphate adenylyltransferase [Candidatus Anammoxibacter sp.]
MNKLIDILTTTGNVKVAVIGDLMLDKYVWGEVKRISQEAPIPVLDVKYEEIRPGGTGNVINNLVQLGATVYGCGVVGDDRDGQTLIDEIAKLKTDISGIFKDNTRTTTVKTRMMGHLQTSGKGLQQLLRVDYEDKHEISNKIEDEFAKYLQKVASDCDIFIISDMDKGFLTKRIYEIVKNLSAEYSIPVIVDPKLGGDYSNYKGFTAITPNRYETELVTNIKITDIDSLKRAGKSLIDSLEMEYTLITIDKDGMFLYRRDGDYKLISTSPKEVNDVSGAGDVVISVLGYLAGGGNKNLEHAAGIANIAAGIAVTKIGAVPVSKEDILKELTKKYDPLNSKIKDVDELMEILNSHRKNGDKVVFTNGCFDLLHVGHVEYLKFSRLQGNILVVGLNSDKSVSMLKGPDRPLVSEKDRAKLLAALEDVDYVTLFDETTPENLIKQIKPDVLVKGEDWRDAGVVGREFVESYGGKVILAPLVKGISTSNIVSRIVENHKKGQR